MLPYLFNYYTNIVVCIYIHIYTNKYIYRLLRRGGKNTQKNYTKKIFMTQIIMMV